MDAYHPSRIRKSVDVANTETELSCPECGEPLHLVEEIARMHIVVPQLDMSQRVIFPPWLNAQGEFAYASYHFHLECWDKSDNALREFLDNADCPVREDPYAFTRCDSCHSGIRVNEPSALLEHGELQMSQRVPNGMNTYTFQRFGTPDFLCLVCTRTFNEEVIELWDGVSYAGECEVCTHDAIWREGKTCTHRR